MIPTGSPSRATAPSGSGIGVDAEPRPPYSSAMVVPNRPISFMSRRARPGTRPQCSSQRGRRSSVDELSGRRRRSPPAPSSREPAAHTRATSSVSGASAADRSLCRSKRQERLFERGQRGVREASPALSRNLTGPPQVRAGSRGRLLCAKSFSKVSPRSNVTRCRPGRLRIRGVSRVS